MMNQKFVMSTSLIDDYEAMLRNGEVRRKIETSLAEQQKGLFTRVGISTDGMELASIDEVKLAALENKQQDDAEGAESDQENHNDCTERKKKDATVNNQKVRNYSEGEVDSVDEVDDYD